MLPRRSVLVVTLLSLAAAAGWGCVGDLERPERFAACPPGYVEQLFAAKCGTDCHDAATKLGNLDLVTPGVGARVRGTTSTSPVCSGAPLLDETGGLMLDKVTAPSCGSRMPLGGAALSTEDVECLRRWTEEVHGGGS